MLFMLLSMISPPSEAMSLMLVTVPFEMRDNPTSEPTHRRPYLSFAMLFKDWLSRPSPIVLCDMDTPVAANSNDVYMATNIVIKVLFMSYSISSFYVMQI